MGGIRNHCNMQHLVTSTTTLLLTLIVIYTHLPGIILSFRKSYSVPISYCLLSWFKHERTWAWVRAISLIHWVNYFLIGPSFLCIFLQILWQTGCLDICIILRVSLDMWDVGIRKIVRTISGRTINTYTGIKNK